MSQDINELGFNDPLKRLGAWVTGRVTQWEDHRNTNYLQKWDEYYRLWRGIWDGSDKTRQSENSKLISPATQQAIESTVSELEEAVFGREMWFDLRDDKADTETQDIAQVRVYLQEDLEKNKAKDAIVESLLNAAIYGTGIAKINVMEEEVTSPKELPVPGTLTTDVFMQSSMEVKCKIEALTPKEFVIDPSATSIDEALGVAQVVIKPKHEVIAMIQEGIYEDKPIGSFEKMDLGFDDEDQADVLDEDKVKIVEYWGKIPKKYLTKSEETVDDFDYDEDELVEAVVTIANEGSVLRAVENPFIMKDRPFVAYQHDRVPNKFWGRGIAEKGYNPQKALDAELRARIDALALTTHPMMGVDATRLPRGVKFEVKPGKTILTNGDPRATLFPLNFGNVASTTFTEASELERMVQMGTGAMDSAVSNVANARNSTASGMSMIQAAAIKRQKRTIMNFQENFLIPMIRKVTWRYMQFDPERYPIADYKFTPYSSMGIMAKELEMTQMIQLLSMTQPGTPAFAVILKSVFESTSMSNRDELVAAVEQMMQPDPQQQQIQQITQQLAIMKAQMEIKEIEAGIARDYAEVAKIESDITDKHSKERLVTKQVELADKLARIEKLKVDTMNVQSETYRNIPEIEHLRSETFLNMAKANKERFGIAN